MKLLAAFLLVAVASAAEITQQRQSSLGDVTKLRKTLPYFIDARDSINHRVSDAKHNASDILKTFLLNVFAMKKNSLQSILDLEAETVAFGAKYDNWCWENNIPALKGIMGWIGTDYSECIMQLDKSVTKIIGKIYADLYKDEKRINQKYSLLDAFEKRNIISNPQSIDDAISKTVDGLRNAMPDVGSAITMFKQQLNGTIPVYWACLNQRLNIRKLQIKLLKKETLSCVDELKADTGLIPKPVHGLGTNNKQVKLPPKKVTNNQHVKVPPKAEQEQSKLKNDTILVSKPSHDQVNKGTGSGMNNQQVKVPPKTVTNNQQVRVPPKAEQQQSKLQTDTSMVPKPLHDRHNKNDGLGTNNKQVKVPPKTEQHQNNLKADPGLAPKPSHGKDRKSKVIRTVDLSQNNTATEQPK